jgi:glycosyltransferase involved in cell wall biosynthesis
MSGELSQQKTVETAAGPPNAHAPRPGGRPLRILIIAPSLDILGGQAVQAQRLLEALSREPSLEVGFLPVNPRLPGPLALLQRIKYVRTLATSAHYAASLLWRVPRYDLLHVFSAAYFSFILAPTPAMLAGRLFGKSVVLNYHSGEAEDHLRRWRRTAVPLMRLADRIAVQSDYLVEIFARFGLKARAVFNHLEAERFRFRERRPLRPVFLANRNFEPHYNVGAVLRAFALIEEQLSGARLIVAGDGSQRAHLEELSQELSLRAVEFRGRVAPEEMPALYDEADVYLNASEIDSMPISILEAFASGLPVVTTEAGGIPFIVANERNGLVVPVGDHEALAAAALRLFADGGALARQLADGARKECEKYSWSSVRDEWLKVYTDAARGAAEEDDEREKSAGATGAAKVKREVARG